MKMFFLKWCRLLLLYQIRVSIVPIVHFFRCSIVVSPISLSGFPGLLDQKRRQVTSDDFLTLCSSSTVFTNYLYRLFKILRNKNR